MNSINEEQKQRINEDLQLLQYDGISWSANGNATTLEEAIAEVEQEGRDIGFNAIAQVFKLTVTVEFGEWCRGYIFRTAF